MNKHVVVLQLTALAVLAGLSANRYVHANLQIAVTLVIAVIITLKLRTPLIFVLCVLGLALGAYRSDTAWRELRSYDSYINQEISFRATVLDDAIYGFRRQAEFYVDSIQLDNGTSLPGKIRVSGFGPIEVKRGDRVAVSGQLRRGYGSYQGSVGFSHYEVLSRSGSPVEAFRHRFIADSYSVLPEPEASLGLGFLAGFQSLLPETLKNNLSATGLTHIVAVSGYNTTILASAVQTLLAKRGSRKQVAFATLGLLALFMSITGAAPSIVRASVVSGLSLIAWYYGRRFKPSVLLLVSAAVTAYVSPLYLWYSLGWWLSFLAFFGVLVVAPLINERFFSRSSNLIVKTALETTSAQLMTLPLIIWVFGRVSVIALVANLLVLPVIPLAMLATFMAGLVSMSGLAVAGLVAWPARLILNYVTDIVTLLARIPWSLKQLNANQAQMLAIYAVLAVLTLVLHKKQRVSPTRGDALYLTTDN